MLIALDHVNLHTPDPEALAEWYCTVLGLTRGPRPDFGFPGAWLYVGDEPVVHLVGTDTPLSDAAKSLEHFAFRAKGAKRFEERLAAHDVAHEKLTVPGTDIVQFHVRDPMGTHIHVDFRMGEET